MKCFAKQNLRFIIAGAALILAGAVMVVLPAAGRKETEKVQSRLKKALHSGETVYIDEKEVIEEAPGEPVIPSKSPEQVISADEFPESAAVRDNNEPAESETRQADVPGNTDGKLKLDCIGILSIPKIGVELPVVEGLTEKNLKYALAHMHSSAAIGEEGSCCIFGHRSYTYGKYFNRLDELIEGDIITIETGGGVLYEYAVEKKEILDPDDPALLDGELEGRILSLITCHPTGVASHRLVIRARQIPVINKTDNRHR